MAELKANFVQLVITLPPYWQLKDYGTADQIGYNDSYEDYINNLNLVWKECYRVLENGDLVLVGEESVTSNIWLMRTDDTGNMLWSVTYTVDDIETSYTIIPMEDGSYTITGRSRNNVFMVRTEPDSLNFNSVRLLDSSFPSGFMAHSAYPQSIQWICNNRLYPARKATGQSTAV